MRVPPCRRCPKATRHSARWLRGLLARAHLNIAVVALAAKLARIAWAVLAAWREVRHAGCDGVVARGIGQARCTWRERLTRSAGGGSEMA